MEFYEIQEMRKQLPEKYKDIQFVTTETLLVLEITYTITQQKL